MKKMLTIIVPLAMVAFASVGFATAETAGEKEIATELSQEINSDLQGGSSAADSPVVGIEDGDSAFNDAELNDTNSRDSDSSIANRRGRQARRGLTASGLSDVQKHWGNGNGYGHHGGNPHSDEGGDEDPDEDEDPDVTPV